MAEAGISERSRWDKKKKRNNPLKKSKRFICSTEINVRAKQHLQASWWRWCSTARMLGEQWGMVWETNMWEEQREELQPMRVDLAPSPLSQQTGRQQNTRATWRLNEHYLNISTQKKNLTLSWFNSCQHWEYFVFKQFLVSEDNEEQI